MPFGTDEPTRAPIPRHWRALLLFIVLGGALILIGLAVFLPMKAEVVLLPR